MRIRNTQKHTDPTNTDPWLKKLNMQTRMVVQGLRHVLFCWRPLVKYGVYFGSMCTAVIIG
jgi:hypothetical protein